MAKGTVRSRVILCVLAGGRSSRFGSSKLAIRIDGEPVLHWQARLAAGLPGLALRWLSVAPGQPLPPGAREYSRCIADPEAFAGPLEGLAAVLKAAGERDRVMFVPADMVLLRPRHLAMFVKAMRGRSKEVGMMARWTDGAHAGQVEPFPSLWRAGPARRLIRRAMAAGVRGPSGLAVWPGVAMVQLKCARDAFAWRSINSRDDLAAARRGLPGRRLSIGDGEMGDND